MLTNTELDAIATQLASRIIDIMESKKPTMRWLTVKQAKEYAGLKSDNTIRKWIVAGQVSR